MRHALTIIVAFAFSFTIFSTLGQELNDEEDGFPSLTVHTDQTYQPPRWFQACGTEEVVMADSSGSIPDIDCRPTVSLSAPQSIPSSRARLEELAGVNRLVNQYVTSESITDTMRAVKAKQELLKGFGWPHESLTFAITELPRPDPENEHEVVFKEHIVVIAHLGPNQLVLDTALDRVLPWICSPGRLYGIQYPNGIWHPVIDDRHDPLDSAIECS